MIVENEDSKDFFIVLKNWGDEGEIFTVDNLGFKSALALYESCKKALEDKGTGGKVTLKHGTDTIISAHYVNRWEGWRE